MKDTTQYKHEDLVLKVTPNIDPAKFDMNRFEPFLDSISGDREYQKATIRTVCNYLFGEAYPNLRALAGQNYKANPVLREKYPTLAAFEAQLQLPEQLACSVDLATGTGKSYVIYAIARIALAAGKVDRVLVLCPSNTIEAGLLDKFHAESKQPDHTDVLPADSVYKVPHVTNATETVLPGGVCIENRHAVYAGTKSAIEDSFKGMGDRTLVLCDEAHHIYTPEQEGLRRWKEFLLSPEYGFRYVVGFSGTCYVGNEYFTDVVARYPLRQATDDGRVKQVEYTVDNGTNDAREKLQQIYENHLDKRKKYKLVKPVTIIITRDIPTCKRLTDELIEFLAEQEGITEDQAAAKVMRVHTKRGSGQGAKEDAQIPLNLAKLRAGEPDQKDSPVEWITSVSMLTEGWDVKNVFQIVPHEERAFNSKLLISQVLGRGLRVPPEFAGQNPMVTVFNHAKWSGRIKELVEEVLEEDKKVTSAVAKKDPAFDFSFHHIDYEKSQQITETKQESEYNFDMPYVNLAVQRKVLDRQTVYEAALTSQRRNKTTAVRIEMYSVEEVVNAVYNKFKAIDLEEQTEYAKKMPKDKIRNLIRASLDQIKYDGNDVSKENKQRILSSFGNLKRAGSKSIRYKVEATNVRPMKASGRGVENVSTSMLRRGIATVFYDDQSKTFDPVLAQVIGEIEDQFSDLPKSAGYRVPNSFLFKTCLSVAVTVGDPERRFLYKLVQAENAAKIDGWLKNTDSGFYEIEYSYSRGDYSRRGMFNPDFFISMGTDVLVVEIKEDDEAKNPSPENAGKRRAAETHFELLNQLQGEMKYHFCFLTPSDYDLFFAELREGRAMTFRSGLDVELMK